MSKRAWPVDSEDTISFWGREGFGGNVFCYGANVMESGDTLLMLELSPSKMCKMESLCHMA